MGQDTKKTGGQKCLLRFSCEGTGRHSEQAGLNDTSRASGTGHSPALWYPGGMRRHVEASGPECENRMEEGLGCGLWFGLNLESTLVSELLPIGIG